MKWSRKYGIMHLSIHGLGCFSIVFQLESLVLVPYILEIVIIACLWICYLIICKVIMQWECNLVISYVLHGSHPPWGGSVHERMRDKCAKCGFWSWWKVFVEARSSNMLWIIWCAFCWGVVQLVLLFFKYFDLDGPLCNWLLCGWLSEFNYKVRLEIGWGGLGMIWWSYIMIKARMW